MQEVEVELEGAVGVVKALLLILLEEGVEAHHLILYLVSLAAEAAEGDQVEVTLQLVDQGVEVTVIVVMGVTILEVPALPTVVVEAVEAVEVPVI